MKAMYAAITVVDSNSEYSAVAMIGASPPPRIEPIWYPKEAPE